MAASPPNAKECDAVGFHSKLCRVLAKGAGSASAATAAAAAPPPAPSGWTGRAASPAPRRLTGGTLCRGPLPGRRLSTCCTYAPLLTGASERADRHTEFVGLRWRAPSRFSRSADMAVRSEARRLSIASTSASIALVVSRVAAVDGFAVPLVRIV